MTKILFVMLLFAFSLGCAGFGGLNFTDGTWSMCELQTKKGYRVNLPFHIALPVGAETPRGTVIKCTRIPKAVQ